MISPVSVIVPLYDGERYVGEAIESILAQTMPPAEIIVVDDGSSDGGAHIAESYAPRVRVLRQPNSGAAVARNRGVEVASQPYLAFLDYDDLWTARKLEVQIAALEATPQLAGVFGHMIEFVSPDVPDEIARRLAPNTESQPGTLISCMLARAADFHRVGPLAAGSHADFVDWYLRARDLGLGFEILPDLVLRRRVHGRNLSLRDEHVKRDYLKHIKESLDRRRADR